MSFNGNGDFNQIFLGEGTTSAPSQAFFYEQDTGIYHDTDTYPNNAWTVVKKGQKRIRISDTQTNIYGTVQIDNLIPGTGSDNVTLSTGSLTSLPLNFSGHTNSGIYYDTKGNNVTVVQGGNPAASFNSVNGNILGSVFSTNEVTTGEVVVTDGTNTSTFQPAVSTFSDGSTTHPSIAFNGGTDSGLYFDSTANHLGLVMGGGAITALFTNTSANFPGILTTGTQTSMGALSCGALTSTTINSGTNSLTCGSITSSSISSGTNSITCGPITSGTINSGTNALTAGATTCSTLKCGIGRTMLSFDTGVVTLTSPNIAGGFGTYTSPTINFSGTFSSTPTVVISINFIAGGGNWGQVIAIVFSASATGFTCFLTNAGVGATTGNVKIGWVAFN